MTTAAVPINDRRDLSSSPYIQKKRNDQTMPMNNKYGNLNNYDEEINRMISFNLVNMEEQEKKYHDVLEHEKHHYQKKDRASRELIADISKKLKQSQQRIVEESRVAIELKKRHDLMKKKMEKVAKDKQENQSQLKSLYTLFQQQRKALEVSINKTKRLEEDNQKLEQHNKQMEDQFKLMQRRIDQLENDKDQLQLKYKREKEQLESEVDDKRQLVKRYEGEFKEISNQKIVMKKQIDEYEQKIKKLIIEFEESSKKHIKELNDVHEQYRGYKSSSIEFEQRISQYKSDYLKACQSEREAKKEAHKLRLENDELREKLTFIELRYNKLIKRMGASQEDLQAIDDQIMLGQHQIESEEDDESHIVQQKNATHKNKVAQGKGTNNNQHPFQKVVNVRQIKNDSIQIEDYDQSQQEAASEQQQQQHRIESILDRRGGHHQDNDSMVVPVVQNEIVDSYEYYGDQYEDNDSEGVIVAGSKGQNRNQNNESSSGADNNNNNNTSYSKKKVQSNKKNNIIEVLDDERPIEQYYDAAAASKNVKNNLNQRRDSQASQSGDLLGKLIENINGNPALQNEFIKNQFKLDQIQSESDLHNYKNLLNSMAALFYTNHRMNDVTLFFYMWRDSAIAKLKQKLQEQCQQKQQQQQQQTQSSNQKSNQQQQQNKKKIQPPAGIQIDTELANQEVFKNYDHKNQDPDEDDEYNSSTQQHQLEDGDDDEDEDLQQILDKDQINDLQVRQFVEDLKQVGPYSKQILNYTYPPLLYQRSDEDDEDEDDNDSQQKLVQGKIGQMINQDDDDDDDEDDDEEDEDQDFDNDQDIQKFIQGAGIKNEDLYNKLKNVVKDKEAQQYIEQIDEDGNVYLVEADQYGQEDEDGEYEYCDDMQDDDEEDDGGIGMDMGDMDQQLMLDGGDIEDEEFLQMMEQEAQKYKKRQGR